MKILIISKFDESIVKDVNFIPAIGFKIDHFYTPLPSVSSVICYPSKDTMVKHPALRECFRKGITIDAIVTVS